MTDSLTVVNYQSVREAVAPFELVAELTQAFASSRCIERTLALALERIAEELHAAGGAAFLLDEPSRTLKCVASWGPVSLTGMSVPADQGIVGRSVRKKRGELVSNVSVDPDFFAHLDEATGFRTVSLLCSPIVIHDQCLGAIELVNRLGESQQFTPQDLLVLEALAAATGLAILSARSTERLIEQERLVKELELAARIQKSMLPQPQTDDFPVHGVNMPARVVSGDFYDIVQLKDGRIGFNIGDVAGKGFRSALLMAKTASLYRCLVRSERRPATLLHLINRELCETSAYGLFVTMITGIYDPTTGLVRVANAGHLPALVRQADGDTMRIEATMPPLGVIGQMDNDTTDTETRFYLDGGILYLFTDGVTEGRLPTGETMDIDGLDRHLQAMSHLPVLAQLQATLDLLSTSHSDIRDDVTLVAIDDGHAAAGRSASGVIPMDAQRPMEGELLAELTVAAEADRLRLVRQTAGEAAAMCGFDGDRTAEIVLAVDEACQNIIRHAYRGEPGGRIELRLHRCSDRFVVLLRDFAEPVDMRKVRPRALDDIRCSGLGTHLMRQIMDEIVFEPPPDGCGNVLRMVKRII